MNVCRKHLKLSTRSTVRWIEVGLQALTFYELCKITFRDSDSDTRYIPDASMKSSSGIVTSFYKSRVSDQNGVSLLFIIVEIYHSGRKPLKYVEFILTAILIVVFIVFCPEIQFGQKPKGDERQDNHRTDGGKLKWRSVLSYLHQCTAYP